MRLTPDEEAMLAGREGRATKKAMEILSALGRIYGARRLIEVRSVQISGVSYENLGEAGLEFLEEMAADGRVRVPTTLNPAGMDLRDWRRQGIPEAFAERQNRVIDAFARMGVAPTCTCTPYLVGNRPGVGDAVAWGESSAVCYANSVLGARTNREGGPSALASALTGKTAKYGFHLDGPRRPVVTVEVREGLRDEADFGALGKALGEVVGGKVPYITGIEAASPEQLKALCASFATYGGGALFHARGVTPGEVPEPAERVTLGRWEIARAREEMNDRAEIDFVAVGCPHCSLEELRRIAGLLEGKRVVRETWIAAARRVKEEAEAEGTAERIERSGAKIVADTCFVVAPIRGRFRGMATNSAKAVYYGRAKNRFRTVFVPMEELIGLATTGG